MAIAQFDLELVNHLPWSPSFPEGLIEEPSDPNASMLVPAVMLPRMHRNRLRLFCGRHGWIGIAADGLGKPLPLYYDPAKGNDFLKLPFSPLAGLRRADGSVLLGDSAGLHLLGKEETLTTWAKGHRALVLDGPGTYVWTTDVNAQKATLYDGQGNEKASYPAKVSPATIADPQGNLCVQGTGGELVALDAEGNETPRKGLQPEAFDILVGIDAESMVVLRGGGIYRQSHGKPETHVPLLSAGLTQDGKPFIAGFANRQIFLHTSGIPSQWHTLPATYSSGFTPPRVLAVASSGIWVQTETHALLLNPQGEVKEVLPLNAENFRDPLFRRTWTLESVSAYSTSEVYLSCSGPDGVAILRLKF